MQKSAGMKSLMNPLNWSYRTLYFLGAMACFGAIGYALYVQYHMLMQPCPLCILQRVAFAAAGVFFLIGALHAPEPGVWRRFHAVLVSLSALGGLLIAGRHIAIQLAPAAGLPPELPGNVGADLATRQLWWMGTVAATMGGLGLFAFGRGAIAYGVAALLLILPHAIGAPELDTYYGVAPAELSAHYAARALAVGAASWAILGAVAGAVWSRPA